MVIFMIFQLVYTAQNIEFGYFVKKKENKTKMICKYNMKKVFWRKTIFALSSHNLISILPFKGGFRCHVGRVKAMFSGSLR